MAKKQNFSHIKAQEALEQVGSTLDAENLPYVLLSTFCGYGDASLDRVRDGRDNKSRDPGTILVKDKFVYRPFKPDTEPMDTIISLKDSAAITRHNPRLYITCDGSSVVAYDPKDDDLYEGALNTLWRDFEFFKPLAGIEKFRNYEEAEADVKTAELMAKLYDDICRYNDFRDKEVSHYINVFMSRLLFCFFAEDTGLFKPNQFTQAIEDNTSIDGSDLAEFIDQLFVVMSTDDKAYREQQTSKVVSDFPYVNGGLFLKRYPIPTLSRRARLLMIQCGKFQWGEINPDIFGSMTQAIVSPEQRSELGIHYTSVPNIMKVIQPLFLDDLASEFLRSRNDAKALNALLVRMSKIKFFDPACGSGNFLIISYKRVRELEIEIWKRLFELKETTLPFSSIQLTQFYGIEIDEYACDTATLSLWLAEHQMDNKFRDEFGTCPDPLPLRPSGHIVCGNACRIDWDTVCPHTKDEEVYVMGNPPYLGSKKQLGYQKNDIESTFSKLNCRFKDLDYICCWFYKGAQYIQNRQKLAFVSTNSITQGEQVPMLWPILYSHNIEISFAYKDFKWTNNAKDKAGVTCVIIGIQHKAASKEKALYNESTKKRVTSISPYLLEGDEIVVQGAFEPIQGFPTMEVRNMTYDGGYLVLSEEEKEEMVMADTSVKDYLIKLYSGNDILDGITRYTFWIPDNKLNDAMKIPSIAQRVNLVKRFREHGGDVAKTLANKSHQFRYPKKADNHFIAIPTTTSEKRKYLPIALLGNKEMITHAAYGIYDSPIWIMGILSSRIHMLWIQTVCGKLGMSLRYSSSIGYNVFPFPQINSREKECIESLVKGIILTRAEHTEMTLAEMYNPESMPADLLSVHQKLDLTIERCYREKPFESDEERLEFLFKLYVKMTSNK